MRRYIYSDSQAIAMQFDSKHQRTQFLYLFIMSIVFVMMTGQSAAQNANKKVAGTLQTQVQGKLQWLGKAVIDNGSFATQAQSGELFEYMSINQQPANWPAMQKEPIPMVLTQVDELPKSLMLESWEKWLMTNGISLVAADAAANTIKYSISYLVDANGQLMEASIKGNGSLEQDAVLQQFIQQKDWKAAQLEGRPVAYRGFINLVFLQ